MHQHLQPPLYYTHHKVVWDAPASQTAILFIPNHFGLGIYTLRNVFLLRQCRDKAQNVIHLHKNVRHTVQKYKKQTLSML